VQTALDLVQTILTHRHRPLGLLLTELGGYLLSPAQAPAGTKRISNLIHCPDWLADDVGALLWQQTSARVQAPAEAGDRYWLSGMAVLGKARKSGWRRLVCGALGQGPPPGPSPKRYDLAACRAANPGARPAWDGLVVVRMDGSPSLADLRWWTTRGASFAVALGKRYSAEPKLC